MFALLKLVRHTTLDLWQHIQPPRFFSVSSINARNKWSKDPEIRRQQYDKHNARFRERYAQDIAFRERHIEKQRERKRAMSDDDLRMMKQHNGFYVWVRSRFERGNVPTWRTHTPEYSLVKKTRRCFECGVYRNKRLWWKRKDGFDLYDVCITPAAMQRAQ